MVGDNEDSYDGGPTSNLAFWFASSFLDSTHPAFEMIIIIGML